jgi:hypothetical protein
MPFEYREPDQLGALNEGKHSGAWAGRCAPGKVVGWGCGGVIGFVRQVGVRSAGCQGFPVMARRSAVMTLMPCLRAVSM